MRDNTRFWIIAGLLIVIALLLLPRYIDIGGVMRTKAPVPPYEEAIEITRTDEILAENPDCGNTKWDRSNIILEAQKKDESGRCLENYNIMVTLPKFRPGPNDLKNAAAFDDKAKRLVPGKKIRIVGGIDRRYIYPGMSYNESELVTVKRIGGRDFIIVPISRIDVLSARTVTP